VSCPASELGTLYELGNVVAVEYPIDNVPPDKQIEADLIAGAAWLGRIYGLGDKGLYVVTIPAIASRWGARYASFIRRRSRHHVKQYVSAAPVTPPPTICRNDGSAIVVNRYHRQVVA
jgi:hypothetical protein